MSRRPTSTSPSLGSKAPLLALAGLLAVALATLAGTWAGRVASPPEPEPPAPTPAPARVEQAGPAQLLVPGAWRSIPLDESGVAGLDAKHAAAFVQKSEPSVRIVAEFGAIGDPSLMPAALRAAFPEPGAEPARARLGVHRAALYSGVATADESARADVTLMATTKGVLAISCAASAATTYDCASDLSAVGVPDATTLVPTPALALGLRLPGVLERLDRDRRTHRAALARAGTRWRRAAAAGRLAADHARAAATLRPVAGAAGASLLASLASTQRAYRALQRAARNRWRSRFIAARQRIQSAETGLRTALASVPKPSPAPRMPRPRPEPVSVPAPAPIVAGPNGVSPLIFILLALLAAGAGLAAGTAGAAPRLWRTATAGRTERRA
jgi:hypothetical protein